MAYSIHVKLAVLFFVSMMGMSDMNATFYSYPAPYYAYPPPSATVCMDGGCEENSENMWLSADLLCLKASEDGFGCDFGSTRINSLVENGQLITNVLENRKEIHFGWNVGCRLGAGYEFDCNCWDVAVYWTYYHENSKKNVCGNEAHWKLRFNEVDALIGYEFTYNDYFSFRPFFGARFANIYQKFSTDLQTEIALAGIPSSLALSTNNHHEQFYGAGPLVGFEVNFCLGCGFSVYGNLAGNLLYGTFDTHFRESDLFAQSINNRLEHSKSTGVLTGYDAGLGVRYHISFVTLQLGLEHHAYCDYNKIGCGGDLNLYGINASVLVGF